MTTIPDVYRSAVQKTCLRTTESSSVRICSSTRTMVLRETKCHFSVSKYAAKYLFFSQWCKSVLEAESFGPDDIFSCLKVKGRGRATTTHPALMVILILHFDHSSFSTCDLNLPTIRKWNPLKDYFWDALWLFCSLVIMKVWRQNVGVIVILHGCKSTAIWQIKINQRLLFTVRSPLIWKTAAVECPKVCRISQLAQGFADCFGWLTAFDV